ncbi:MAG: ribosomal protein L7/L12 [Candidatus Shikimatogenerans bostrichidophilus]|nr:MAG: ribosomal protein L7/L12 [Candidatus Shikimatogenerans bostrichidophilus]
MKKIKEIAKKLVNLNIKEINKLYNILEKNYNIKINTNYSSNINSLNTEISKKDDININKKDIKYDIYLNTLGTVKLPVIKLINNITGKSLTESKKLIDKLPSLIKESISLEEAKKIQEDFKKLDVIIELKESN